MPNADAFSGMCLFCPVLQQRKDGQVIKLLELLSVSGGRFPFQSTYSCIEQLCVYCHNFTWSVLALWSALCHDLAVFRELSLDWQESEAKWKWISSYTESLLWCEWERKCPIKSFIHISDIYGIFYPYFGWSNTYYMSFVQKSPHRLINIYVIF